MSAVRSFAISAFLLGALGLGASTSHAQQAPAARPPAKAPTAVARTATPARPKFRKLAPNAMRTVDPQRQLDEAYDRHDVIEVLTSDPKYAEREWAKGSSQGKSPARNTVFRRDIWSLEFSFKPVRFVRIDEPMPDGRMQNKLVWYLLYSIKNTSDQPVTFVPYFVLVSNDRGKVYPSRVIPLATPLIRKREDQSRPLLNTSEMIGRIAPTPKGQEATIWGVATWEDIDPATDHFSIYVQGLTNAYRWENEAGAFKKGSPPGTGRHFYPKTLILNFWRPGDKEFEHEGEIRFENYAWGYGELTEKGFIAKKRDSVPAGAAREGPAAAEPAADEGLPADGDAQPADADMAPDGAEAPEADMAPEDEGAAAEEAAPDEN
jgi:hypothetical protein